MRQNSISSSDRKSNPRVGFIGFRSTARSAAAYKFTRFVIDIRFVKPIGNRRKKNYQHARHFQTRAVCFILPLEIVPEHARGIKVTSSNSRHKYIFDSDTMVAYKCLKYVL